MPAILRSGRAKDLQGGCFNGSINGTLIGLSGWLCGMRWAEASPLLEIAASSAVVTGIVLFVVVWGLFGVVFYVVGT